MSDAEITFLIIISIFLFFLFIYALISALWGKSNDKISDIQRPSYNQPQLEHAKDKHSEVMQTESDEMSEIHSDYLCTVQTKRITEELHARYEIIKIVGRGGMALVFEAKQRSLNRIVALKVLPDNLVFDFEFLKRFQREAQAAASLNHPNIIAIYDVGSQGTTHYIAMQYVHGLDLHRIIQKKGQLAAKETVLLLRPIAEALDYAHRKGVIHRDVKSSNIIVDEEGRPLLMDFGIAYAASGTKLTRTGITIGTPEYMSPEQAKGEKVDGRCDIYSLGAVMYECLTGRVPYTSDSPLSIIYKKLHEDYTPIRHMIEGVPEWLERIVDRCLAKHPDDRFQSGREVSRALSSSAIG